jgi:hypothetical protein
MIQLMVHVVSRRMLSLLVYMCIGLLCGIAIERFGCFRCDGEVFIEEAQKICENLLLL